VVADEPVTTFVVDRDGLEQLRQSASSVDSYGGFWRRGRHHQSLRLPYSGEWYLVIENTGNAITDLTYKVVW
jgi:hypothetical protein